MKKVSSFLDYSLIFLTLETWIGASISTSGQKPVITRAKKSIAGFRLREGMAIGAKVNLAGRLFFATCDFLANVKPPYLANGIPSCVKSSLDSSY